ncbi:Phosphoinositide phosphatase sac1 [Blastocladiella emersonii ATCC 22665]|nr:Phosphoinositide phosphatase sac1 [Blastocladiella emersonii ATCC 22665]
MAAYNRLRLYVSNDAYTIEPIVFNSLEASPRVLIRRDTGEISVIAPNESVPLSFYEQTLEIDGVLGLVPLLAGDYLVVITRKRRVGRLFPDSDHDVYAVEETKILPVARSVWSLSEAQRKDEDAYLSLLERMCQQGHMYFSTTWDLTSRTQANLQQPLSTPLWQRADRRFFWNHYLQSKLIAMSQSTPHLHGFILPVICGYVKIATASINHKMFQYALITRKSVHRVGTRYHSRGIDDQGHVANYAETEQLVCYQVPVDMLTHVRSFVQIRGSIPLFWRQKVNSKYTPVLELVEKPNSDAVFASHVNDQFHTYGTTGQVMVNLINKKGYELPLGREFQAKVNQLADPRLKYVHFDFHEECKKMRYDRIALLVNQIQPDLDAHGALACTLPRAGTPHIAATQSGVVRTNCIDCLDRTNVVQSVLAKHVLVAQLRDLGVLAPAETIDPASDFERTFKNMWADNADVVSVLYSGTGALKTDYTRTGQRTKRGALNDGWNSVVRYVKNNFLDGSRQDAYDLFLGNYRPANQPLVAARGFGSGGKSSGSPYDAPRFNQAHTLVLSIVLLAAFALTLALLLTREFGDLVRYQLAIAFLVAVALSYVMTKFGTQLVDLPRLVPVDYVRDREMGLGSPIKQR